MLFRERLWLTHQRRLDEDYCPLCFAPIKWVYDGSKWIPCDREPALAYLGKGFKKAVYKRELIDRVWLYRDGAIPGESPVEVLIPHVFNCEELKKK